MLLLNPRRTRTNMKLLQLVWIFLLTLCGQSAITTMMVKEDDDVILDCSIGTTSIENKKFDWKKNVDQEETEVLLYADNKPQPGQQFGNRVTHFPEQLQFGNASIKITKVQTKDNGTYTCYYITEARIPLPVIQATISLTVGRMQPPRFKRLKPRPEIEGAAPRPFTTLHKTNNGMLLQCEVLGAFPKPEVQWWDSDGNVLAIGDPQIRDGNVNKYDTVLNVTVNKSGDYRCVSTQDDIHHQIYTKTHVPGGALQPWATILGENEDGVLLQCVVQGASPELKVSWKDKSGNLVPSKEPQKTENSIILQSTVKKTDYYRCVTTEGKKDDELYSEIYVQGREEKSSGAAVGVGTVVALLLVAVVVAGGVGIFVGCRCRSNTGGSSTDGSIEVNGVHSPLQQNITNNPDD